MKKELSSSIQDLPIINPIQGRIKMLLDNDFLPHEIAVLTGLRKKLIKAITKGKYIPYGDEQNKLLNLFDEAIVRLNISTVTIYEEPCPEADLDTEDKIMYKLDVTSVSLYKGTDDKNMIIQIHGDILNS